MKLSRYALAALVALSIGCAANTGADTTAEKGQLEADVRLGGKTDHLGTPITICSLTGGTCIDDANGDCGEGLEPAVRTFPHQCGFESPAICCVAARPQTEFACTNDCRWAGDGECDDGGEGADWDLCLLGSDCLDCGIRTVPAN